MKSIKKLIIILIFILYTSSKNKYKKDEDIIFLGDINIENAINDFKYLLVFFSVKWCSYLMMFIQNLKKHHIF